jgi:MFS transporter, DHA2 family, glioxin efflux transporter
MSRLTSPSQLQYDEKLEDNKERASQIVLEREKQTIEPHDLSTAASSSDDGMEKPERPGQPGPVTEEERNEPQKSVAYPKGLEMFFIMLALVLSITLCSLDQVSSLL